jgi:hypothetical protein
MVLPISHFIAFSIGYNYSSLLFKEPNPLTAPYAHVGCMGPTKIGGPMEYHINYRGTVFNALQSRKSEKNLESWIEDNQDSIHAKPLQEWLDIMRKEKINRENRQLEKKHNEEQKVTENKNDTETEIELTEVNSKDRLEEKQPKPSVTIEDEEYEII